MLSLNILNFETRSKLQIIMNLNPLEAISPIDGRYRNKTEQLADYFSESALIKYRIQIEVEYYLALSGFGLEQLSPADVAITEKLRSLYKDFSIEDAQRVKEIEQVTNHDVKAIEYFIKEKMGEDLGGGAEFVHFGLTSQDINNTAVPLSIKDALQKEIIPGLKALTNGLEKLSSDWSDIPMLARTHGQPASPTRLGKEFRVFAERLNIQLEELTKAEVYAKFGGATGNFNAHVVAFPAMNWVQFGNDFLKSLGLKRQQTTTQIEHYDQLAGIFDNLARINTILIDLSRDIWTYISMEYFKQKINKNEVGSSAMPHKVNPIDFENAEGNLGIANAILRHLSGKLPISRLQRDLTDSTVLRNVGVPFAHMLIALNSLDKGLGKLLLNEEKIRRDLADNWAVVAEAIQTILRREGYPNPYEALKELTRTNESINEESMSKFIETLNINDAVKEELKQITPFNYTGVK